MSLRTRLLLAATYLLTIVVVALEVPLAINIQNRVNREFESGVLSNAALLASRINDDLGWVDKDAPGAGASVEAIRAIADSSARETGTRNRIVVTDRQGRIVADSAGQAPPGTFYATPGRPEFRQVFSITGGTIDIRRRYSKTLDDTLLLVTVPVVHNREAIGAVRFSQSTSEVNARVQRSWLGLILIGIAVVVVGLLLAWFLATSLARPVQRLEEVAGRLGRGQWEARADTRGPKEVATLAQAFNQMAAALSANLAAQQDFLANASHQLRTPLTGLKLRLEAIEAQGGLSAEQAAKAQVELDRLTSLVNDLLELARASSVQSTGTVVDLNEVAREALDRWSQPATSRGHSVKLEADGRSEVWADPADLGHVLDNLIENAIRYSPPGGEITIAAGDGDDRTLKVTDNGPGIPPEDRERIFERFYRGSNGRRSGPGTGLGLAIVAELVRRWDGEIKLTDAENGGGTCIEATFPPFTKPR